MRPKVRPWALFGPILLLLICLPLLRPLRHPDDVSDDEAIRLETVRSIVETGSLNIEPMNVPATAQVMRVDEKVYADQPPVMAVLLAGPYWLMRWMGYTFQKNPVLVPYLLTVIGTTLPVAASAGLLYRMNRLFELSRPWRTGLALLTVLGSGLVSYAVVLNPHAPAAVLVLCAAGCLIHVVQSTKPARCGGWIALSGLCAATAITFDPAAIVLAALLALVILAIRFRLSLRIAGVLLFLIGMVPPIVLHLVAAVPTGNLVPQSVHEDLSLVPRTPLVIPQGEVDDEEIASPSVWLLIGKYTNRLWSALVGSHGILSHFPLILFGFAGILAVMHRHWPGSTKMLATATGLGAVLIVLGYCASQVQWRDGMFASRWFIVFLPMLMYWMGAWVRRNHRRWTWCTAAALALFSVTVSLIGATNPYPRNGFDRYTVVAALMDLVQPQHATTTTQERVAVLGAH
jgi:hypothetical protein